MPEVITTETETADPIKGERDRVKAIRAVCNGEHRDIEAQAIDDGWTIEATKGRVLDAVRAGRGTPHAPHGYGHPRPGAADPRTHLTAACMLMGGHGERVVRAWPGPEGERLANGIPKPHSWLDLCGTALRLAGRDVPADRNELIRAAASSTSLPQSIGSSIEKTVLQVFTDQSMNWKSIARVVPAISFRAGKAVRLAAGSKLELVGATGEIKHGAVGEDAFDYKIDTYAKMFSITRQDLISDNYGVLADLPLLLGAESARTVADLFFSVLTGNAGSFFGSGNANQLTAGSALSITTLATAVAKLRVRTDKDGRVIGFVPETLLVPAALEQTARSVLHSTLIARGTATDASLPMGNPFLESGIGLAVEPRLDATSATAWYLFAQAYNGAVLLALLDGRMGPVVEQAPEEADTLGMMFRAYMDMGVSLAESRAAVQATGAS